MSKFRTVVFVLTWFWAKSCHASNAAKEQKQNIHGCQSHQKLVESIGHFLFDKYDAGRGISHQSENGHNQGCETRNVPLAVIVGLQYKWDILHF